MLHTTETEILAPFEIWEVPLENGNVIKFHKPLILQPEILPPEEPGDETYLIIEMPALDLSVCAVRRDEFVSCACSDIQLTWKRCVWAEDASLTRRNRIVKRNFLALAEEI